MISQPCASRSLPSIAGGADRAVANGLGGSIQGGVLPPLTLVEDAWIETCGLTSMSAYTDFEVFPKGSIPRRVLAALGRCLLSGAISLNAARVILLHGAEGLPPHEACQAARDTWRKAMSALAAELPELDEGPAPHAGHRACGGPSTISPK